MDKKVSNKTVSKENVEGGLSNVMHPEINNSLVGLGMIGDISIVDSKISVTLLLPFLEIPIKEDLISLIKGSIEDISEGLEIKVKTALMTNEQRENFLKMAREGWKF